MKVFLIILAVLVVLTVLLLSLSAEFTIIFDNGWTTRIKILFIEKDIELSKILNFILFPEKAAADVKAEQEQAKEEKEKEEKAEKKKATKPASAKQEKTSEAPTEENEDESVEETDDTKEKAPAKPKKKSPIQKIIDEDGIVGIMLLISNLIQTANSAVTTLIKGLHIYSLYVKMIIGGSDAADIAEMYGNACGFYYPIKGFILNGMKVDQYDDLIMPDFIAPRSEYEFQLIGSMNIKLILKILLKAGSVFVVNLVKNK